MADIVEGGVDFPPGPVATVCGFTLGLPRFSFKFNLPSLGIPIPFPFPSFALSLTCRLPNPINVTDNLPAAYKKFGGARTYNAPADADDNPNLV